MGVAMVTSARDRLERVVHLPVTRHNHAHCVQRYANISTTIALENKSETEYPFYHTYGQDNEDTLKDTILRKINNRLLQYIEGG